MKNGWNMIRKVLLKTVQKVAPNSRRRKTPGDLPKVLGLGGLGNESARRQELDHPRQEEHRAAFYQFHSFWVSFPSHPNFLNNQCAESQSAHLGKISEIKSISNHP